MIKKTLVLLAAFGLLTLSIGCGGPGDPTLTDPDRERETGGALGDTSAENEESGGDFKAEVLHSDN